MEKKTRLSLSQLPEGCNATVIALKGGRAFSSKIIGMGVNIGSNLKMLHSHQPSRGPILIGVGDTRLMIGHGMADQVIVHQED